MTKILITGISGFIGQNLAEYLYNKGYEICGIDVNTSHLDDNFDIKKLDISRSIDKLPDHDIIVHLAGNANIGLSFTDPIYDFNNNVIGTINLLEYNRKQGNKPIIFTSSYRVYPIPRSQIHKYRIDLDGPRSIYGCSKLTCELYLKEYHHLFNTPIVVNRLSCIYGEGQIPNSQGWVTLFVYNKIKGYPVEISGDGKQIRDCLYIEDLVRLIELEIKNIDKCSGNIYDIGGGTKNAFSLLELVEFLDKEYPQYEPLSKNIKMVPEGKSFRAYISDLSDVEWLWKPEISIWDGIRRTARWCEDNANTII